MIKYLYVITNGKNNKKYVGSSQSPEHRFKRHMYLLHKGKHTSKSMQKDYCKYGDCFLMNVIKAVPECEASAVERGLMIELKTYDSNYGYNDSDNLMKPVRKQNHLYVKPHPMRGKHKEVTK